jgi:antitoxin component YwqK of YwqJK toxin-antitoxin module
MADTIIVPDIFTNFEDKGFTNHQDTLFLNDTKYNGIVYALYNTGDTAFLKSYYNGVEEGLQKKWYPNKKIAEIRLYHLGKKTGKHIGFWENGKSKFEFYFLNGEHQGVAKEWYQNGNPYRSFHYDKGYELGSQKMWWENGTIRANYVVKNNRRYGLIGLKLCMNQNDTLKK